jgi:hypothetical protein
MLDSLDTLIAFVTIMLVVSMLITIAVQMLAAALNLRGINLAKGLVNTFNTILPGFEDQAQGFADRILGGRLLSDTSARIFGRRATAVRPQEVFDAMLRIATGRREVPVELRDNARRILRGLGMREAVLNTAEAQVAAATGIAQQLTGTVQQLRDAATTAIAQLPADQQTQAQNAIAAISDRLNAYEVAATRDAAALTGAVEAAYKRFHYWFDVSQERAQQWFTAHTRWFTIIFAIIFAFWFQLDTVEIFRLVSSNRAVRDALVAQSGIVIKQAEKLLGDNQSVLQQALASWRNGLTDDNAKNAVATEVATPTETRGSLREKVQKKLVAAGIPGTDDLLSALDSAIDKTVQESLKSSGQQFSDVKLDLDKTGFSLFPAQGKGRWGNKWGDHLGGHIWGMIFSAALLSLGAPFWFNALKGLASLRSKVAENISTEQAGDKAPPGATLPRAVAPAPRAATP